MDKIYRRPTQLGGTPKRKKNEKNRVRNMIMNFRVSPVEKELIEARIRMSGMSRTDFFIESCLYQKILVKGNIRTFTEIKNRMKEIEDVVEKNPNLEDLDQEQMTTLRTILEILNSLFEKENKKNGK